MSDERTAKEVKTAVNSALKGDYVKLASEIAAAKRVKTGLLSFDEQTGGGLPMGVPISIQGRKSVGKSAWCYNMLGKAQEQYGGVLFVVQAESGFDGEWATQCGLPPNQTIVYEGEDLKPSLELVLRIMREQKPTAVLLDSLSMLSGNSTSSLVDSKSRGERAVPINEFFRKMIGAMDRKNPPLFLYIEHLHPVMDRPGLTTTGGETKGYANGMEIRLTIDSYICTDHQSYSDEKKKVELPVQAKVAWEIKKSKACPFRGQGTYNLGLRETSFCRPGEIDDFDELVVRGILSGHIHKAGSWFTIIETGDKYQGAEQFKSGVSKSTLEQIIARPRPDGGEANSPVKTIKTKAGKRGGGAKGRPGGGESAAPVVADGAEDDGQSESPTAEVVAGEDSEGSSE